MKEYVIGENEAGQRLDKFLAKLLREAPKSFLYKMLRKKNITLNSRKASGNEKLVSGDTVRLFLSDETFGHFSGVQQNTAVSADLEILYEDNDLLLINKPAGMLSQPDRSKEPSAVEYLTGYLLNSHQITEEQLATFHPGVVNRLDRNTSGILVCGKSLHGLQTASELFRTREIKKYYLCLAEGVLKEKQHISGYLVKNAKNNKVRVLSAPAEGAERIETGYEPLADNGEYTLLQIRLYTGKAHQIRAHLASIGHPVAGDPKYNSSRKAREWAAKHGICRQLLHAERIVFPEHLPELPPLEGREIAAPLPEDFGRVLSLLQLQEAK